MRFSKNLVAGLLLVLLAASLSSVSADWVDPETPWEARITQPYNVRPPHIDNNNDGGGYWQPNRRSYGTPEPTFSAFPSVSSVPTEQPSAEPTMYPTYVPKNFQLVFSDEFNTPGRSFGDGNDPRWTALEKNDYTNDALHYYSAGNAKTDEMGNLVITSEAKDTEIVGFDDKKHVKKRDVKHFKSAMLQSWNKFCFTGGILEAEVSLPGRAEVGGLWPALWMLGNLARHTYVSSSEHMWPWSSLTCTEKSAESQLVSGCHKVAHYGLEKELGRGAPEIDVFEVQAGNLKRNQGIFLKSPVGQPFMSASFQVAPGRPSNRPGPGEWPGPTQWYQGLMPGANTSLNIGFYGNYNHFAGDLDPARSDYWSDAISMNRQLNETYFNKTHVYRLEWDVPTDTTDGYLHWFLDGELVFALNGTGLRLAGLGSVVSTEPSYILVNTAISKQWGFPIKCPTDCGCKNFDCHSSQWQSQCGFPEGFCDMMKKESPEYKMNWIRVYQDPSNPVHKVGCSTPERPTRRFIQAHQERYKSETDDAPLKPIQRGQGPCEPDAIGIVPEACGGNERGRCTPNRVCECMPGWTGPHCLAHEGFDPIPYDVPDELTDVGFVPPRVIPHALVGVVAILAVLFLVTLQFRHRFDGWTPLPEVDMMRVKAAAAASAAAQQRAGGSAATPAAALAKGASV